MKLFAPFLSIALLLLSTGCLSDELPQAMADPCEDRFFTYEADIRPIIEASCAYSGCHLGTAPGRFDSYEGLLPVLESGLFRQRVVVLRANPVSGMPPDNAPAGRPKDLTDQQLFTINCWLKAGFPRN